jgi:hypothetical protein
MTYRSEPLRRIVATLPCMVCGRDGNTQASHSNQQRDGKGMGIKAHDYRIAAICGPCHTEIDQGKAMTKEERRNAWDEAHRATIGALFEMGALIVKKG